MPDDERAWLITMASVPMPTEDRSWLITLARHASDLVGLASYLNARARNAEEAFRAVARHKDGSAARLSAENNYENILNEVHEAHQKLETHVKTHLASHTCFRAYPNGDRAKPIVLSTYEMLEWRKYNETFRFGCAQYVDGKCVYKGNLSDEEAKKHETP